jgi:hypothetical protein
VFSVLSRIKPEINNRNITENLQTLRDQTLLYMIHAPKERGRKTFKYIELEYSLN